MDLRISKTKDGTVKYPLHKHPHWEIALYVRGTGFMKTNCGDYPFQPGTVIIIPPGISHGSSSIGGFQNICISGNFSHLLAFPAPCALNDDHSEECTILANLVYANRFSNPQYLSSLCETYIHCILNRVTTKNELQIAIQEIIAKISANAFCPNMNLHKILTESGYAEDYIRAAFKKATGLSPNKFLTKLRMEHACYLMDIYTKTLPLSEIASMCGYEDYIYFSKKFKEFIGMSPSAYLGKAAE